MIERCNTMTKKCLSFTEPLLESFVSYVFTPFAGLYDDNFKLWFIHNFISLRCRLSYNNTIVQYDDVLNQIHVDNCPLFRKEVILRTAVQNNNELMSYVKKQIDNDMYIFLSLNQYYNPHAAYVFQTSHFNHTCLIIGYDDDLEEVTIADYFGSYQCKTISYDNFCKGYFSYEYDRELNKYEMITSVKYAINFRDYRENYLYRPQLLKNMISYYLTGDTQGEESYGFYSYDVISSCLSGETAIERRTFHCLYDHKKAMRIRVNYLLDLKLVDLPNEKLIMFKSIEESFLQLRNMAHKYIHTKSSKLLQRMQDLSAQLKNDEYSLLDYLIREI